MINYIKDIIKDCNYYNNDSYLKTDDFYELPIVSKKDIVENYALFQCNNANIFYTETSGSTGIPLKIAWNKNDYYQSMMTLWRLRKKYGVLPTDFYLTCHTSFYTKNQKIDTDIIVSKNNLSLSKICYNNDVLLKYAQYIKLFKPKWIFAQPSFVYYLGSFLKKYHPDIADSFVYIELSGELLKDSICNEIKSYFPNAKVINMYGMNEFNGIFYEDDGVFRDITDNVKVEILREDGSPCNLNEEGNIVVTGLKNRTFPLIRYNTEDRGFKFQTSNLSYGYVVTAGRSNDELVINNIHYDGSLFFEVINIYNKQHSEKISKFQVIHQNGCLSFMIFSFDNLCDKSMIESEFQEIIYNLIGVSFNVNVQIMYNKKFFESSKKLKYFINLT